MMQKKLGATFFDGDVLFLSHDEVVSLAADRLVLRSNSAYNWLLILNAVSLYVRLFR